MGPFQFLLINDPDSPSLTLEETLTQLGYEVCSLEYTGYDLFQAISGASIDLALIDTCLAGRVEGLRSGRLKLPGAIVPFLYYVTTQDPEKLDRAKADLPFGFIPVSMPEEVLRATLELALKKYQDDLQREESEEKFRMIYENAPLMIDPFDEQGRCVLWNQACQQILGWSREEVNLHREPLSFVLS